MYQQDNDDKFPSLDKATGWRDSIMPYVKSAAIFHCPSVGGDTNAPTTDYWFNARLSALKEEKVHFGTRTFMLGEGYTSSDPRVAFDSLPTWRDDEKSPAWRHLGGANYAFAGGYVKWLKPTQVTIDNPEKNYTFALK